MREQTSAPGVSKKGRCGEGLSKKKKEGGKGWGGKAWQYFPHPLPLLLILSHSLVVSFSKRIFENS